MQELADKVAVVTGAGSGIGRGIALSLAAERCKLAVLDIDRAAAEDVAAEIEDTGGAAIAMACDVSVRAEVLATAEAVFGHYGAVHVLCNNAGVTCYKAVTEMTDDDWDWMIGVDLMSVVHGYQAYLPRMLAQRSEGHIVNTSSGIGVVPDMLANHTAYAACKAASVALASSLRVELADSGIGVSVVCPGMVRTRIFSSGRTRPERYGGPHSEEEEIPGKDELLSGALDPLAVGGAIVKGIKANRHFIFPQAGIRDRVVEYYQSMLKDFEAAEA